MSDATKDRLSRKQSKLKAALKELREQVRGRDLKRFAIVGRAVLARADRDPAYRENLMSILDAEISKESERELFGLAPGTGGKRGGRRKKAEEGGPAEDREPAPEVEARQE